MFSMQDSIACRLGKHGNLFSKNHGILCMKGFYEWVLDENKKKKVIEFYPSDNSNIITPVLYDIWMAADRSEAFASFAVVTTDPNKEVLEAGHDRSPINLETSSVDDWLHPSSIEKSLEILKHPKAVYYNHKNAKP